MSFGRLERPTAHKPMSEINVTPLVDVMLVLLVIFIITAPLMASRLALNLPQVAPQAVVSEPANAVMVSVGLDAAGQAFWVDEAVDSATLSLRLREAAQRDPDTEVQLRADTAVPYGRVVQVIAQAQAAGLARIGFVADPAALAPPTPAAVSAPPATSPSATSPAPAR
jgi:biopolymer transport protein TolR